MTAVAHDRAAIAPDISPLRAVADEMADAVLAARGNASDVVRDAWPLLRHRLHEHVDQLAMVGMANLVNDILHRRRTEAPGRVVQNAGAPHPRTLPPILTLASIDFRGADGRRVTLASAEVPDLEAEMARSKGQRDAFDRRIEVLNTLRAALRKHKARTASDLPADVRRRMERKAVAAWTSTEDAA